MERAELPVWSVRSLPRVERAEPPSWRVRSLPCGACGACRAASQSSLWRRGLRHPSEPSASWRTTSGYQSGTSITQSGGRPLRAGSLLSFLTDFYFLYFRYEFYYRICSLSYCNLRIISRQHRLPSLRVGVCACLRVRVGCVCACLRGGVWACACACGLRGGVVRTLLDLWWNFISINNGLFVMDAPIFLCYNF